MFKKFKDKLAEEVKSSPQRIQQFAQAAQAVVTSASSSISDITNNDLFSIGENDNSLRGPASANNHQSTFQDICLAQQGSLPTGSESLDTSVSHEETSRQRRLSNSSFASDISFRLPIYESPSMYHLQSDMDISASEAEEKGFSGGTVNLDRVTKEQLYAAYRRTQGRFTKYKTQYADLARHYKLLERENAKARNVLVETQDKALRRISELREQCTLEQNAKAHLERALRVEIEEQLMKIDTLNTKLKLLQEHKETDVILDNTNKSPMESDNSSQLVDLTHVEKQESTKYESLMSDVTVLNNKVSKMEQLLNKYKESHKNSKEKNAQMIAELQILSTDLENKNKEIEDLKASNTVLNDARQKIDELNDVIEKMQNTHTAFEFKKNKEISVLKLDLKQAHEEITQLNSKIEGLSKREEEYAISLAENKLSIHKELEAKEAEIKSLKDSLSVSQNEILSLNIVVKDYKNNILLLEEEKSKFNENFIELNLAKTKIKDLESQVEDLAQKCQYIENLKGKLDEEYKCLQLQLKQETAEKLAMIDRNDYLENRNTQLLEDSLKKGLQINNLESELKLLTDNRDSKNGSVLENQNENLKINDEVNKWKTKYIQLESEIQEEREELVKLQTEIEKLLCNHESVQTENFKLHSQLSEIELKNRMLQEYNHKIKPLCVVLINEVNTLQQNVHIIKDKTKLSLEEFNNEIKNIVKEKLNIIVSTISNRTDEEISGLKSKIVYLEKELKIFNDVNDKNKAEILSKIKQYEDLQTKLLREKTEHDMIKETLHNNLEQHNVLLDEIMILKHDKQNLDDALQLEIEQRNSLTKNLKHTEEEITSLTEKIKAYEEVEENYLKIKKEKEELLHQIKQFEELKLSTVKNNETLMEKIAECEKYSINKGNENMYLEEKNKLMEDANNELNLQTDHLGRKISESEEHNKLLRTENEKLINEIKLFKKQNSEIETKYQNLIARIKDAETKNSELRGEQSVLQDKFKVILDAKAAVEELNETLQVQMDELKTKYSTLEIENQEVLCKLNVMAENNSALLSENGSNLHELNKIKDSNVYLQEKVNILRKQNEDDVLQLEALKTENLNLKKRIEDNEKNKLYAQDLEKDIHVLRHENKILKNQCEAISNNVKVLEVEMLQVRNSHLEIEKEKRSLEFDNKKIESDEQNPMPSDTLSNTHSLTSDHSIAENNLNQLDSLKEVTNNTANNYELQQEILNNNLITTNIHSGDLNSGSINCEYALLKEENRRLRSDIEGLQTYLAKISKENGHLNDKLREVITSNDNFTEQSEISQYDIETLRNEIQSGKDKIDNLTRENILLVEENLELKDQIHFHSYKRPSQVIDSIDSDENINNIKIKYNSILESKNNLEKRVKDLEHMNLSTNSNMQEMQIHNEKLRLSNDKLERRLDEALVSLRHLHSLQENTELEYLRNILYEYLTGSGTHSVTLAKVLSAVVKFNDSQTELVLQKERERQGFLRQLGIIKS